MPIYYFIVTYDLEVPLHPVFHHSINSSYGACTPSVMIIQSHIEQAQVSTA